MPIFYEEKPDHTMIWVLIASIAMLLLAGLQCRVSIQSQDSEDISIQSQDREDIKEQPTTQPVVKKTTQPVVKQTVAPIVDPLLKHFSATELQTIRIAANRNDCNGDLFLILLAIRKAENGRSGLEFGVMHPRAKNTNLDIQAGWAAATVVKNYQRWLDAGSPDDYIIFLSRRYCPVGAANDPNGLNVNWVRNVKYWYENFHSQVQSK